MFHNSTELSSTEIMLNEKTEEMVQRRDTVTFQKVL